MEKLTRVGVGRTAEVLTWEDNQVIKLYYDWCPPSWAEYEAKIAEIVQTGGLPCPAYYGLKEVNGRMGLIYELINGPTLMSWLSKNPWKLGYIARLLAELQYKMHSLSVPNLPAQRERLKKKIGSAKPLSDQQRQKAWQILEGLPDGDRLCHGDFHPENILLSQKGPVVIDWVDSTRGNPHSDVGRTCLLIRSAHISDDFPGRRLLLFGRRYMHDTYLKTYSKLANISIAKIRAWDYVLAAARLDENIAEEEETLLSYLT